MFRRLLSLDAGVVLASLVALALVGPLRGVLQEIPVLTFAGTLLLFVVPGALMSSWFLREHFPAVALVPAAFVISTAFFSLLGVPMLVLHRSLTEYLWVSGGIIAVFVLVAAVRTFLRKPDDTKEGIPAEPPAESFVEPPEPFTRWLWAPFLALGVALAFVSRTRTPVVDADTWVYLAYVREYLNTDKLALFNPYFGDKLEVMSRVKINGWLLEHAAFSRVAGIDPVNLVLRYLAPTLIIVALLAFYALARSLFKSELAGILAGSFYTLFLLVNLNASQFSFGGEFVGRMVQDKFATLFLFLPIALCMAVGYVESSKKRYLAFFLFLCWAVVTIHPVGIAIFGLSMAGFGLFYVAVNWRSIGAWLKMVALAVALLSVALVPVLFALVSGESVSAVLYSADIGETNPKVLANMVFVRPEWRHIWLLGDDLYIMHPYLILNPTMLLAYVLGVPFLLWRLRRSLAAQLLLGVLLVPTVVCYVPQIATFVGDRVIAPGQLYRMAWPIPVASVLILSWMGWEAVKAAQRGWGSLRATPGATPGATPRATGFLPLAVVAALTVAAAPAYAAGVRDIYEAGNPPPGAASCFDPALHWISNEITTPSVVLAPDAENLCIPSYSAEANVVSYRGAPVLDNLAGLEQFADENITVPQGALDVQQFFSGVTLEEGIEIIRRQSADYVMVYAGTPLDGQLKTTPGFVHVDIPGSRYSLYEVDYQDLDGSG